MQTLQGPEVLEQPFCAEGDKNTIPSAATGSQLASLEEGFPEITQKPIEEGGIPPEREDFNGALNLMSQFYYAFQNGWLPTFDEDVSEAIGGYAEGAVLWYAPTTGTYANKVIPLRSTISNNTYNFNLNSSYIGTYWVVSDPASNLPPHVFTSDNVTAGTDIEINQIIDPYVLNEDTVACFHLNGDTNNAVDTGVTLSDDFKAHITGYTDPLVNPWYPGRSAAIFEQGNQMHYDKLFQDNLTTFGTTDDYTLEFFVCPPGVKPSYSFYATDPSLSQTGTYPMVTLAYTGTPRYKFTCYSASGVSQQTTFNTSVYKHVAMVRKNQVCYAFIDGVLQTQSANSLNLGNFFFKSDYQPSTIYVAEIVFSKIAKWDSDFTPPSAPYHQQEGGDQYEIKSTVIDKHATNCVTEIPRRVNLELSSGTMTLKAGSKVYVPNGSSTFDETTIANDITATESNDNNYLCFTNGTTINKRPITACFSGSTAPTLTSITYAAWYDTANNVIKLTSDGGSTWATGYSFPFCSITVTSGAISSIDAVFNGFGYIGSTIFVLPGIKGLIPDGKNVDDTLKSIEYTQESVYTNTLTGSQSYVLHMGDGGAHESTSFVQQVTAPSANYTLWYSPSENKMRRKSGSGTIVTNNDFVYGFCETVNGVITSYNPYTVIRMLDYNEYQANPHVIETYHNGAFWYRVWNDGWCEQGGESNPATEIVLLKTFKDTNYTITGCPNGGTSASSASYMSFYNKTTTGFYVTSSENRYPVSWEAKGYIF